MPKRSPKKNIRKTSKKSLVSTLNQYLPKKFRKKFMKRPVLYSTLLSVTLVLAISGGAYGIYKSATPAPMATQSTTTDKEADATETADTPTTSSPTANNTETSVTLSKPSASPSTTGSGCPSTGCPNATGFSINTTKSVSLTAGTSVGPFTASTSDGSKATWSTPAYNGAGPYGYTNGGKLQDITSYEYYIRAEPYTPPGTYTLTFTALNTTTRKKATASITVTVLQRPYFNLSTPSTSYEVNESEPVIEIPYTIHPHNGYSGSPIVSVTISSAPDFHYLSLSAVRYSNTSGAIIFDTSGGGVPEGPYTVSIYAYDAANPGNNASTSLEVFVIWYYS